MLFEMRHKIFKSAPKTFSDQDAPEWLTGENSVPGSTMDNRWFWKERVLTLKIGETVDTSFQAVTRIA